MDPRDLARRAEIARRLKAARWLAGDIEPHEKGKVGYKVKALEPDKLAERDALASNGITASLLGSIERMERPTPPMELEKIATALGLQRDWFVRSEPIMRTDALALVEQLLADLGLGPGTSPAAEPEAEDDQDHPGQSGEGAGG